MEEARLYPLDGAFPWGEQERKGSQSLQEWGLLGAARGTLENGVCTWFVLWMRMEQSCSNTSFPVGRNEVQPCVEEVPLGAGP